MTIEEQQDDFILNSFFLKIESKFDNLPEENKKLLESLIELHATHAKLEVDITKSIAELYKIIIDILQNSIKAGAASKEQKEILEKLKNLANKQEKTLADNQIEYNENSKGLIEILKNMGID